jgi:hypothetical protein
MSDHGSEYKSIEEVRSVLYPGSAGILDLRKEDVLEFPANLTDGPLDTATGIDGCSG